MDISRSQVEHVAHLARLAISDEEASLLETQLSAILTYVETLNRLETSGVEATSHVIPMSNVLRDDEVVPSLSSETALANAPDHDEGCFRVPKIIE